MNPFLPTPRLTQAPAAAPATAGRAHVAFRWLAGHTAAAAGSPWAFAVAVGAVVVWGTLGPHFRYSDTWQLVINTGTTIVTFLMVFLIQNTQNRDARAIHMKLDELIRATAAARDRLVDLENCTDDEIARFEAEFRRLRERSLAHDAPPPSAGRERH